jgi:hypothetical protein
MKAEEVQVGMVFASRELTRRPGVLVVVSPTCAEEVKVKVQHSHTNRTAYILKSRLVGRDYKLVSVAKEAPNGQGQTAEAVGTGIGA